MATITVDSAAFKVVEWLESYTLPALAAVSAGQAGAIDPTTGYGALGDANVHDRCGGLFVASAGIRMGVTLLRKGIAFLGADALDALNFGDEVFLSTTPGGLVDIAPGVEEVQSVDITGTPDGGTFTLAYKGDETGNIAYNADAATVQAALEALSTIGTGNVVVTGTNPAFAVKFVGELAGDVDLLTLEDNSLTGGSTPSVAVTVDVAGADIIVVGTVVPLFQDATTGFSLGTPQKGLRVDL